MPASKRKLPIDDDATDDVKLDKAGRICYSKTGKVLNFQFESFQNCLSSLNSIEQLKNDCVIAFNHGGRISSDMEGEISSLEYHNKGSTWWITADGTPQCALERLAQKIFFFHTKGVEYDPKTSGAEWWTQVVNATDDIGFHWDKDYGYEEENGVCLYPHLGTVTYLTDIGGPTFVFNKVGGLQSGEDNSGVVDKVVVSKAMFGKHIKFDGQLLHAAPSQTIFGPIPTASQHTNQKRITFLVNIWLNHRTVQCKPFPPAFLKDFSTTINDSSCFLSQPVSTTSSTQNKKNKQQKSKATFLTKSWVPTILLKDQLKVKGMMSFKVFVLSGLIHRFILPSTLTCQQVPLWICIDGRLWMVV